MADDNHAASEPELIGWGPGAEAIMGRRWCRANPPRGSLAERQSAESRTGGSWRRRVARWLGGT